MRLTFGKYAGQDIQDVPRDYLRWHLRSSGALITEIEFELGEQPSEPAPAAMPGLPGIAKELIEAGYRTMALKIHPDTGGEHINMVQLNVTVEKLRRMVAA